jgi:hypothetical protein
MLACELRVRRTRPPSHLCRGDAVTPCAEVEFATPVIIGSSLSELEIDAVRKLPCGFHGMPGHRSTVSRRRSAQECGEASESCGRPEIGPIVRNGNKRDFEPAHSSEADVGGPDEHRGDAKAIAHFRECRDAIAAGKPLPLLPVRPGQPARTCAPQFLRGLPEAAWSSELNAKLLEIAQSGVGRSSSRT